MQVVEQIKQIALDALDELKGNDIITMNIKEMSSIADYMIVCSARSNRHLKSLANEVNVKAKHAGFQPLSVSGETGNGWVLVDLGDVIVHLMLPEVREFYSLEKLWSKKPKDEDTEEEDDSNTE